MCPAGEFPFWRDVDAEADSAADPATRLRMIALRVVQADYCPPPHLSPAVVVRHNSRTPFPCMPLSLDTLTEFRILKKVQKC